MTEQVELPYRLPVYGCLHPETYKYFFPRAQVQEIWLILARYYGPVRRDEAFKIMEVEAEKFFFRATWAATPVTVIRKRLCTPADVEEFHQHVGFKT